MDPHDDDIEFDFFDEEPATGEAQPSARARLPGATRRRPRGPVGPPRGAAPLLRLFALVVFVIFLVLVFALLVQSCASTSRHDSYAGYVGKVSTVASQSTADGKALATALETPLKVTDIVTKLRSIADHELQLVQAAENLNPPGRLRTENGHLVEALQLRVSGVNGLADIFQKTASSTNNSRDANLLADAADQLLASDVVWDDLFKAPTVAQLQHDGVNGVVPPESQFIAPNFETPHSMALVLQRLRGASTGGAVTGLHGTNIVSVKALPAGQTLATGSSPNTVTASTDLTFAVTVQDSGNFQEVDIPVTLSVSGGGGSNPISMTQTIKLINPGQSVVVNFTNLGAVSIAVQHTLRVDVKPVRGEVNKANNTASYPIILSLPGG